MFDYWRVFLVGEKWGHIFLPAWISVISGWWFGTCFIFHFIYGIILDVILPIDFHIFQDGCCTTNQHFVGVFS